MASERITSQGTYVEVQPDEQVWLTSAGAYVEFRPKAYAWLTSQGVYIEFAGGVTPDLRMRHGKGFVGGVLMPYGSEI